MDKFRRLTSLSLAVRMSKVVVASEKVSMITFPLYLPFIFFTKSICTLFIPQTFA